jgi:hypothetical protein
MDIGLSIRPFELAQRAIADLKIAVFHILISGPRTGLKNSEIGRALGLYMRVESGAGGKLEGAIPRLILQLMDSDGSVKQDPNTKKWRLVHHFEQGEILASSEVND